MWLPLLSIVALYFAAKKAPETHRHAKVRRAKHAIRRVKHHLRKEHEHKAKAHHEIVKRKLAKHLKPAPLPAKLPIDEYMKRTAPIATHHKHTRKKAAKPASSQPVHVAKPKPHHKAHHKHKATKEKLQPPSLEHVSRDVAGAQRLEHLLSQSVMNRADVAAAQRDMGALDVDGLVGPATMARAKALLGHELVRPAKIPISFGILTDGDKTHAALDLYNYVVRYKGKRPERIKAYQHVLGVTEDGKLGPKTKTAAAKYLGWDWS